MGREAPGVVAIYSNSRHVYQFNFNFISTAQPRHRFEYTRGVPCVTRQYFNNCFSMFSPGRS